MNSHVQNYKYLKNLKFIILNLLSTDKERWNLAWMHMSHYEARRKSPYWKNKIKKVLDALKTASG